VRPIRRFIVCVLVFACPLSGLAVNLLETARPLGGQRIALTFGFGVAVADLDAAGPWFLVPQGRLAIGLLEGLDLGLHSGWASELGTGTGSWLGLLVDAKVAAAHLPGRYSLAWGAGGGFGLDFFGDGWGVFLQLLFESHSPSFPVFVTYRFVLPLAGGAGAGIAFEGYISGGMWLPLSPIARLLLALDVFRGLPSLGVGLEIDF